MPLIFFKLKKRKYFIAGLCVLMIAAILITVNIFLLYDRGVLHFHYPSKEEYPVRGLSVSYIQGEIDWKVLSGQADFIYIKATEGAAFRDAMFSRNAKKAASASLLTGYSHFITFDCDGEAQAENFIQTTGDLSGMLPPATELSLYGIYRGKPPEAETVREILSDFQEKIKAEYGVWPIIKCESSFYSEYIDGHSGGSPIWIVKTGGSPDDDNWTLWTFSRRHLISAEGEKYADVSIFSGSYDELREITIKAQG